MLGVYPDADLFGLVNFLFDDAPAVLRSREINTSLIQRLPFARTRFRTYLPLMPMAVEGLDVSDYDVVISSNHAVANGVRTHASQLHLSYVHTPMRYAWDLQRQYMAQSRLDRGPKAWAVNALMHYLRIWDAAAARGVDHMIANSQYVAKRIAKTYQRDSTVIYPPVDIDRFTPASQREDFYLAVGRMVPYKRFDLVVEAFNKLGLPLVLVGAGPQADRVRALCGRNVEFRGAQSDEEIASLMGRCRGFVFAAEEDFGITTVEAQAAGAPVVGLGRGGTSEIVLDGRTGVLFAEQTVEHLTEAVERLEARYPTLSADQAATNAQRFSRSRFRHEFETFVDHRFRAFESQRRRGPADPIRTTQSRAGEPAVSMAGEAALVARAS